MNLTLWFSKRIGDNLSTVLAVLRAALALAGGWALKRAETHQTQTYTWAGVSAEIPARWLVSNAIASEELIFSAHPPLDFNYTYQVRLLPAVPGGKPADLAVSRNLAQGQALAFYRVTGQQALQLDGRSAYQVTNAYVKPSSAGEAPVVISGRDVYLQGPEKILLVTLENLSTHFTDALPDFEAFVHSVSYQKGGSQ
jgi:hypothetical protein